MSSCGAARVWTKVGGTGDVPAPPGVFSFPEIAKIDAMKMIVGSTCVAKTNPMPPSPPPSGPKAHFAPWSKAVILLRRILPEVFVFDVQNS